MSDSQSGDPTLRDFQFDTDLIGDVGKSVNVYRGDITLPQQLVALPGPNGLDLNLTAVYSSNVKTQVETWNVDAPTGILGLGWDLPITRIELIASSTASWFENGYRLWVHGTSYTLVPVQALDSNDGDVVTFSCRNYPLWQFTYTSATETWTVVRDDGGGLTFGDPTAARHTVQWGLKWDNWAGSVNISTGVARYAVAWNLSIQTDRFGNAITYGYVSDDVVLAHDANVSAADATYTRASYLDTAIAPDGRWLKCIYGDKQPSEYQATHADGGKAYPDRYETRYLSMLRVLPSTLPMDADESTAAAAEYFSLAFGFEVKDLDRGDDDSSTLAKRYLTSVTRMRNGQATEPATDFTYDWASSSESAGIITSMTYPAGGIATWELTQLSLNSGNEEWFSMNFTVDPPAGFEGGSPRVWFGSDYAVVLWILESQATVTVYSYGGVWTEPWSGTTLAISPSQNADDFILITGSDYFAFYGNRADNPAADLILYKRSQYDYGRWEETRPAIDSGSSAPSQFDPDLSRMVAGDDFLALHLGGDINLNLYSWDETARSWNSTTRQNQGSDKFSLAVSGDTVFASYYDDSSGKAYDVAYRYGFFTDADTDSDADAVSKTWGDPKDLGTTAAFTWDSDYLDSYFAAGTGFATGTYQTDGGSIELRIYRWDYDSNAFLAIQTVSGLDSRNTHAYDNVIANGGQLLRYTASAEAASDQFQTGWAYDPSTDMIVTGDDVVFKARIEGSGLDCTMAAFELNDDQLDWDVVSSFPSDTSQVGNNPPQLSGDWLTIGTQVYLRQPGTWWSDDANATPVAVLVTPDSDGTAVNPDTIVNRAPSYIAYQNTPQSTADTKTYVCILQNGQLLDPVAINGALATGGASGTLLAGPSSLCTYIAQDGVDFSNVQSFVLHRILDYSVEDVAETTVASAACSSISANRSFRLTMNRFRRSYTRSAISGQRPTPGHRPTPWPGPARVKRTTSVRTPTRRPGSTRARPPPATPRVRRSPPLTLSESSPAPSSTTPASANWPVSATPTRRRGRPGTPALPTTTRLRAAGVRPIRARSLISTGSRTPTAENGASNCNPVAPVWRPATRSIPASVPSGSCPPGSEPPRVAVTSAPPSRSRSPAWIRSSWPFPTLRSSGSTSSPSYRSPAPPAPHWT